MRDARRYIAVSVVGNGRVGITPLILGVTPLVLLLQTMPSALTDTIKEVHAYSQDSKGRVGR